MKELPRVLTKEEMKSVALNQMANAIRAKLDFWSVLDIKGHVLVNEAIRRANKDCIAFGAKEEARFMRTALEEKNQKIGVSHMIIDCALGKIPDHPIYHLQ